MRKNILALYIIKLSKWFSLVMPIIVLFYEDHGLRLQDIFILKSIYSVAAVSLEIPSGYLADVWGRKKCILSGCILFFVGYLVYSLTGSFQAFIVAEILLGCGQTLVNGADSALLYDTTARYGKENLYMRYEGKITMLGNFAEAFAGILGGFIAVLSLRYPFYIQAAVAFTGIPAALFLTEISRKEKIQNPFSEIIRIMRYSLVTNRPLCYNIMYSGIIGAATLTMAWFVQPFLMYFETPTSWYGIIWTVLNLTVGIAALYSDRIEKKFGMRRINLIILLVITGGYIGLAGTFSYFRLGFISVPHFYLGLLILFIFYIFRGFATPILKGYINQMTFSEMRATVLSIRNFVIRLMFAAIAPFAGWMSDMYSLEKALLASAGIFFVSGLLFLILQRKASDN